MLMRLLDRHTLEAVHVSLGTELVIRDSTARRADPLTPPAHRASNVIGSCPSFSPQAAAVPFCFSGIGSDPAVFLGHT